MRKTFVIYGVAMAAMAFALQWLEYQFFVRTFSNEIYIVLIALFFTALGVWTGRRSQGRAQETPFERNEQALSYLGISEREYEVLERLALGASNREIAEGLFISQNTVKTHLGNLYGKLQVSRRTQAVLKAKELRLVA